MPNIKIIYIALAIVLTQTVRLEDSHKPYNLDMSNFKLFVGQKKANLPLASSPRQNANEGTDVLVVAYLDASNLTPKSSANQETLGLAKDSLKVLFLKGITDFSADKLQENCENGEIVGAFETSESWVSGKDEEKTFNFLGMSSYNWTKKLDLTVPKVSSGWNRFSNWISSTPSFETKTPNLTKIGLSLSLFDKIENGEEDRVLKVVKDTTFKFEFTLSVEKANLDFSTELEMKASPDATLLNKLEEKYQKIKTDSKGQVAKERKSSSSSEKKRKGDAFLNGSGKSNDSDPLLLGDIDDEEGNQKFIKTNEEIDNKNAKNIDKKMKDEGKKDGGSEASSSSGNSNLKSDEGGWWKSPYFYGGVLLSRF